MSSDPVPVRRYSARRLAAGVTACPSCLAHITQYPTVCPTCGFTGGDTMKMFPYGVPPLEPIMDTAGIWSTWEQAAIRRRLRKMRYRFPQLRWCFCSLHSEEVQSLRLFGFWMLNASPLAEGETPDNRAWTVLVIFNTATGDVATVPGYEAEPWLDDGQWERLLGEMAVPWSRGKPGVAVVDFLRKSEEAFRRAWRRVKKQIRGEARQS
jgi:hypothetical protein